MRTLILTEEDVNIIKRALGISEMTFSKLKTEYAKQVVNVRGVDDLPKVTDEINIMLAREDEFCSLLLSIENGEKDI